MHRSPVATYFCQDGFQIPADYVQISATRYYRGLLVPASFAEVERSCHEDRARPVKVGDAAQFQAVKDFIAGNN